MASRFPQQLINVKISKDFNYNKNKAIKKIQEEANLDLDSNGRVLLRASGTEPLLRVMVEGKSEQKVNYWVKRIASAVKKASS